ncbi:hypothetical protein CQ007_10355 [Pseudomonas sp. MYb185]|nr:hypothetical protein CQ007_10355 [Pseudomonas sp. MYb185]
MRIPFYLCLSSLRFFFLLLQHFMQVECSGCFRAATRGGKELPVTDRTIHTSFTGYIFQLIPACCFDAVATQDLLSGMWRQKHLQVPIVEHGVSQFTACGRGHNLQPVWRRVGEIVDFGLEQWLMVVAHESNPVFSFMSKIHTQRRYICS